MKNLNTLTIAKIAGSYLLKIIFGGIATFTIIASIVSLITKLF